MTATLPRAERRRIARADRKAFSQQLPARYEPSLAKPNKYSPFYKAEVAKREDRREYRAAIKKAAQLKMVAFAERGRFNAVAARSAA